MTRLAIVGAVLAAVAVAGPAVAVHESPQRFRHVELPTRPCLTDEGESSFPCYWDAGNRGNGHGRSFWIGRAGHVRYLDPTVR